MEVMKWLMPSGSVSRIGEPRLPLRVRLGRKYKASITTVVEGRAAVVGTTAGVQGIASAGIQAETRTKTAIGERLS
jgi:hypothetical protein